MTSYPTPQPSYPNTPYQAPPSNGMGIAGFVVSLTGLVACAGLLCPIGLVLSLLGLGKEPRGFAIAGTIIGGIGSAIAAFFLLAIFGVIGAGWGLAQYFNGQFQTYTTISWASNDIDNYYTNNNQTLPDAATGTSMLTSYLDEWGSTLEYKPIQGTTDQYEITSAGPDMQFGTTDDISQQFTAFGFGSHGHSTQPFGHQPGPNQNQIDYAFNQAAEHIIASFPDLSAPPGAAEGTVQIRNFYDPWNNEFRYAPSTGSLYHLKSAGPDGQWNTGDDITKTFLFESGGVQ